MEVDEEGADDVFVGVGDAAPQRVRAVHHAIPLGPRGARVGGVQPVAQEGGDGRGFRVGHVRQPQAARPDVADRGAAQHAHDFGGRPAIVRDGQDVSHVGGEAGEAAWKRKRRGSNARVGGGLLSPRVWPATTPPPPHHTPATELNAVPPEKTTSLGPAAAVGRGRGGSETAVARRAGGGSPSAVVARIGARGRG